jgi:hypothetical protein
LEGAARLVIHRDPVAPFQGEVEVGQGHVIVAAQNEVVGGGRGVARFKGEFFNTYVANLVQRLVQMIDHFVEISLGLASFCKSQNYSVPGHKSFLTPVLSPILG